ncbi:MAG TPA: RNA-binding protein [Firmicutes bacterium]|nr:RNA-binding protein [Bacillota bacterium]
MEKEKILEHFAGELERLTASQVLDRIAAAAATGKPQVTDFLDPFGQRTADRVVSFCKGFKQVTWGGYAGAERARVLVFPAEQQQAAAAVPVAFIKATPTAAAAGLSHRDYLGALLGLGLRREKIGDLLVAADGSAQIILVPEIKEFVLTNLREAGKYRLEAAELTAEDFILPEARTREIRTTVASLRLDAVASAGFGISRSKLAPAIKAGHVKLNWQAAKNASAPVKAGDVISVAGKGRVEVAEILGESRKGRLQLVLKKHY